MAESRAADRLLELRGLLEDLVEQGFLSRQDANRIVGTPRTAEQAQLHPLSYIASCELGNRKQPGSSLNSETLSAWLAECSDHTLYHIDPLKINVSAVTEVMSFQFAKRHQILCVEAGVEELLVATAQPFTHGWEEQLEHTSGRRVRRVVADPADIKRHCVEFYSLSNSISGASGLKGTSAANNFEQLLELGTLKDPEANDQHIVNIVDWLLQHAFDQRASDIHIEPRREVGRIRFRIDGVLHLIHELPDQVNAAVTSRLKILGRMNVAEKRKPQDGRIKTKRPDGSEVELRLSTLPTAFGEKLVMRIFDPEVLARSYSDLGLGGGDLARWRAMLSRPNGIVLVTGPTGSGKTTTLYTGLKQLATSAVNVSTVEDPIEMVEESFNQTQVHHSIGFDFAAGIRTLMRQDPDIIMVGEIRDLETAQMAVQAALTGHLVISTLHTNDAPTAVTRLLDLGLPHYLLKSTILGVMAQRLVRTLCPACKREDQIEEADWHSLVRPWRAPLPDKIYQPEGCLECRNTGYRGRQGIYEILPFSESVQAIITPDCDLQQLRRQAMREGMNSLRLSGARKVAAGLTTVSEVLRVAPPSDIAF
ncbi:GspE/PulE family protein [Microbulbifer sp. OS29]|uniref:GspE/PulE family protein n=1 Tax=Microbulbifer okhotskensis TaxID=2926617 RepID=A0A9X2EKQ7_9GAMM|nr:GspE/PulE family protein [Microbulbifer okhotskensis]MCO1333370.1 GspE/PulE family protein [Microbulbifer okhotskensis]